MVFLISDIAIHKDYELIPITLLTIFLMVKPHLNVFLSLVGLYLHFIDKFHFAPEFN